MWAASTGFDAETASSILFDTVAVYLAFTADLLVMDGMMKIDDSAARMDCATEWRDLVAFEDFLVDRLTGM